MGNIPRTIKKTIEMKTIETLTSEFIYKVKSVLDSADWSYEICHPDRHHADFDKACHYLYTQKFSAKMVAEQLEENWDEIIEMIRDLKSRNCAKDDFSNAEVAAKYIADSLAQERIMKFRWTSTFKDGMDSKKWFICDSLIFKIQ
jgi:hypothetical protein